MAAPYEPSWFNDGAIHMRCTDADPLVHAAACAAWARVFDIVALKLERGNLVLPEFVAKLARRELASVYFSMQRANESEAAD
jgi:hypothetical protein